MTPQIIKREAILLCGFSFYGDPFSSHDPWSQENEIGRLWKRFGQYMHPIGSLPNGINPGTGYEVCITTKETEQLGHFEVFVGTEVSTVQNLPVDLLVKVLPPSAYAVFTIKGETIASDWTFELDQSWLPASGFKRMGNYTFQIYDHRFKGMDQLTESAIDVYIPVAADR